MTAQLGQWNLGRTPFSTRLGSLPLHLKRDSNADFVSNFLPSVPVIATQA